MHFRQVKRREFITLLGGAAAAWPFSARAQHSSGTRRLGVLMGYAESDPEAKGFFAGFTQRLAELGWQFGMVELPVCHRLRVRDAHPNDRGADPGRRAHSRSGQALPDGRTLFFYGVTGITPAMAMRMTGIGSQYLLAMVDADKNYFDGSKTYKVTLPKGIPEANFWSLTLYDNLSLSMPPQRYPRAGSQSYPSPAAEPDADGSTTVYFSPTQPAGVKRGNWIQTTPGKGWFNPASLQPA